MLFDYCLRVYAHTKWNKYFNYHLKGVKGAVTFSWEKKTKRVIAAVPLLSGVLLHGGDGHYSYCMVKYLLLPPWNENKRVGECRLYGSFFFWFVFCFLIWSENFSESCYWYLLLLCYFYPRVLTRTLCDVIEHWLLHLSRRVDPNVKIQKQIRQRFEVEAFRFRKSSATRRMVMMKVRILIIILKVMKIIIIMKNQTCMITNVQYSAWFFLLLVQCCFVLFCFGFCLFVVFFSSVIIIIIIIEKLKWTNLPLFDATVWKRSSACIASSVQQSGDTYSVELTLVNCSVTKSQLLCWFFAHMCLSIYLADINPDFLLLYFYLFLFACGLVKKSKKTHLRKQMAHKRNDIRLENLALCVYWQTKPRQHVQL